MTKYVTKAAKLDSVTVNMQYIRAKVTHRRYIQPFILLKFAISLKSLIAAVLFGSVLFWQ